MSSAKPILVPPVLALAVGLPAALGVAMLAWFLVSLAKPTRFVTKVGLQRELIVAAYGGQVYVISRDFVAAQPFIIAWEAPWGLKPKVWEPDWIAGRRADDWYFGGSLGVLSLVPLLPAGAWLIARTLRRRRLHRVQGFAVDAVSPPPPPPA